MLHRSRRGRPVAVAAASVALALVLGFIPDSAPALAAGVQARGHARHVPIHVTTQADSIARDGLCSLREAVLAAAMDRRVDACRPGNGADTIWLPSGAYAFAVAGADEDGAQSGDLDLSGVLTIIGPDAGTTSIDAAGLDRVFDVRPGATAAIRGVTIRGGVLGGSGNGAGIRNEGTLDLSQSVVRNNTASGNQNADSNFGGGIFNAGSLRVTQSTLAGNAAYFGGGLFNQEHDALVADSTISGNVTISSGAGIYNDGVLTLSGDTIADNAAGYSFYAGGLANPEGSINPASVTIRNTILAHNSGADCVGRLTSQGYNLIEHPACTIEGTTEGNLLGVAPRLGELRDNGGSTPTMALLAGSPAIDAANPARPGSGPTACGPEDQRGVRRPQNGDRAGRPRCDIGAVEIRTHGRPRH